MGHLSQPNDVGSIAKNVWRYYSIRFDATQACDGQTHLAVLAIYRTVKWSDARFLCDSWRRR